MVQTRVRRSWWRRGRGAVIALGLVAATVACAPALKAPGDTASISLVSSTTASGWKFDYYVNNAYPCSISGYQTFTIATKVGSPTSANGPLWVFMHGGGVGVFDTSGTPQPDSTWMTQEGDGLQRGELLNPALMARIRSDPAAFRLLAVSYCDRDIYSGGLQTDPNNPNKNPNGSAKSTNGLYATKAAIQFTMTSYPTPKYFLHGGSAGSVGSYYNAWSLQQQGIAPAGVVGDASVVNVEAGSAAFNQGVCTKGNYDPNTQALISKRVHPDIADPNSEIDKLVSRGELTVPLLHIWNHGDVNTCGSKPMTCPERDGTAPVVGVTDCTHDPLRLAIAAQGSSTKSKNLPLCVSTAGHDGQCDKHVVTSTTGLTNTDPSSPPDYLSTIMDWVHQRLADS